jgi:hypothetical protein
VGEDSQIKIRLGTIATKMGYSREVRFARDSVAKLSLRRLAIRDSLAVEVIGGSGA